MKCDKGWHDGSCCCNCKHHVPLMKHPWNKDIGKGSIKEQMGYACTGFMSLGEFCATFFDMNHEHGMCELHTPKERIPPCSGHAYESDVTDTNVGDIS